MEVAPVSGIATRDTKARGDAAKNRVPRLALLYGRDLRFSGGSFRAEAARQRCRPARAPRRRS